MITTSATSIAAPVSRSFTRSSKLALVPRDSPEATL
jgi:hypothetical protein